MQSLQRGTRRSQMTQLVSDSAATRTAPATPSQFGIRVARRYTRPEAPPLDGIIWDRRRTVISNPDGSVVFQMEDVEVPTGWSQLATDIVVSKYFRESAVPGRPGHE